MAATDEAGAVECVTRLIEPAQALHARAGIQSFQDRGARDVGVPLDDDAAAQQCDHAFCACGFRDADAELAQQARGGLEARCGGRGIAERCGCVAQLAVGVRVFRLVRDCQQRIGGAARGVEFVDGRGDLLVLAGQLRLAAGLRVVADTLRVSGVRRVVDLGAQLGERRVLVGDHDRELSDLRCGRRLGLARKPADRLSEQRVTGGAAPDRVRGHREQDRVRGGLLVFGLEGASVGARSAEDPTVVRLDQELLDQDLLEGVEVCVFSGERVGSMGASRLAIV